MSIFFSKNQFDEARSGFDAIHFAVHICTGVFANISVISAVLHLFDLDLLLTVPFFPTSVPWKSSCARMKLPSCTGSGLPKVASGQGGGGRKGRQLVQAAPHYPHHGTAWCKCLLSACLPSSATAGRSLVTVTSVLFILSCPGLTP